jgi:hypothetical protein
MLSPQQQKENRDQRDKEDSAEALGLLQNGFELSAPAKLFKGRWTFALKNTLRGGNRSSYEIAEENMPGQLKSLLGI